MIWWNAGTKQYKARGVVARTGKSGNKVFIEAQAVVVASGSLMTPPLLLNSGLRNPNIGRGLHLHPVVFIWGYFPEECGPRGTCYEGAIMTSYSPICKESSSAPVALLEVPSTHPGSFASFQPWTSGEYANSAHRLNQRIISNVATNGNHNKACVLKSVVTTTNHAADSSLSF
jgi:long-chain-alcohol oxidase